MSNDKPLVGIILGSKSDAPDFEGCKEMLEKFGVPYEFVNGPLAPSLVVSGSSSPAPARRPHSVVWLRRIHRCPSLPFP